MADRSAPGHESVGVPLLDRLVRNIWKAGWRLGPHVPVALLQDVARIGAPLATRANRHHVRVLRDNLAVATGQEPSDGLITESLTSWLRNFGEVLALPGWSPESVVTRVSTSGEHHLREAYADGGAVVALPHSGNWDLAGAWACLTGMPLTTVAEELSAEEYRAFVRLRETLGMRVLSHRDPAALASMAADLRGGRLVCLMADRDLGGTGVPVTWRAPGLVPTERHRIRLPGGPAVLARRTGVPLLPAFCRYTPSGMHIDIGAPVEPATGRDGLVAMTQQVADFFAGHIVEHPVDWHMMQPYFGTPDLDRPVHR